MLALFSTISIMHSRGAWNPYSTFSHVLAQCYGLASLSSCILAIVGMFRDRRVWMGGIALLVGMFAVFILLTAD